MLLRGIFAVIAAALAIVVVSGTATAQSDGYSGDEAYKFRRAITIDNWDDGGPLMRYMFLNMWEFFPQTVIHRSGPISDLPVALRGDLGSFTTETRLGSLSLDDYIAGDTVDGLLIIHKGKIVYEAYPRMRAIDKHLLMSVSKAYAGTAIAMLEDQGLMDATEPVDKYLPELKGSGWEGVAVRDVLDMASGIDCFEQEEGSFTNPETCYYHYEASAGWLKATDATPDTPFEYMKTLTRHRPPGEGFEYTSINTFVLSWIVERVSGQSFAEFISAEIWQKIGAEADGYLSSPKGGIPIVSGGISATLRDVARFGLIFTPSRSVVSDQPLISERYLWEIQHGGRPEIYHAGKDFNRAGDDVGGEVPSHNSYQWDWVMKDGDFYKGGYGGQGLYISPSRDLVIAFFGVFDEGETRHELPIVARQLVNAGLFDEK